MATISTQAQNDITRFIAENMGDWLETVDDIISYLSDDDVAEDGYLELTIAISDDGESWNFQTGDNSYTGGAYGLPHWAVTAIYPGCEAEDVADDVLSQLVDLLAMEISNAI